MKRLLLLPLLALLLSGCMFLPYAPNYSADGLGIDAPFCEGSDTLYLTRRAENVTAWCVPNVADCLEDEAVWWTSTNVRGCVHIEAILEMHAP